MAGGSDVRAGGAYVEIYANDARLQGDLGKIAGRLLGFVTAFRAIFNASAVAAAQNNVQIAMIRGNLEGMYQAEMKAQDAWSQFIQGIPLIGSAINNAYEAFGDKTYFEEALKNLKEVEAGVKQMETTTRKEMRETAIMRAKLAGKSDAEIAQIEAVFKNKDVTEEETKAFETNQKAQQAKYDAWQRYLKVGGGFGNFLKMERPAEAAKAEYEAAVAEADKTAAAFAAAQKAADEIRAANTATADKGIHDEEKKLVDDRIAFEKKYTDAIADETQRRINAVERQYDEMIEAAKKYTAQGFIYPVSDLENKRDAEIQNIISEANQRREAEDAAREREQNAPFDKYMGQLREHSEFGASITARERSDAQRNRLAGLAEANPAAGLAAIRQAMEAQRQAAQDFYNSWKAAIEEGWADKTLTADEARLIEQRKQQTDAAVGEFDSLKGMFRQVNEQVANVKDTTEARVVTEAFRTSGIGLGSTVQDRTAKACEDTAKNTRDTNTKIDQLSLEFT